MLLTLLDGCLVQPVSSAIDDGEADGDAAANCGAIGQEPAGAGVTVVEAVEAVQCTVVVGTPTTSVKASGAEHKASLNKPKPGEISGTYRASLLEIARYLIPSTVIEPLD